MSLRLPLSPLNDLRVHFWRYSSTPSNLASWLTTGVGCHTAYKCPVQTCNKSFAVRSNAKRHLRTHRSALASSPVLQTLSLDASTSDSIARTIRRSSTPTSAPYPPRRSSTVSALHPAPARLSPPPTPLSLSLALPAPHLHSRGDMAAGSPPPPPLATKPRGDAHTHTAPSNAQGYAGLSADTGPASCFPASLHSRDNAGWLAARGVFAAPGDFEIDLPWAPRVSVPMVAGPSRPRYHDGFAAGASWGGKYEEAAEAASDRAGEGGARRWTDMDPRVDSGLGFPYHPAEVRFVASPRLECFVCASMLSDGFLIILICIVADVAGAGRGVSDLSSIHVEAGRRADLWTRRDGGRVARE